MSVFFPPHIFRVENTFVHKVAAIVHTTADHNYPHAVVLLVLLAQNTGGFSSNPFLKFDLILFFFITLPILIGGR